MHAPSALQTPRNPMIIDCHGHYTTEPEGLKSFREEQVAAVNEKKSAPPWSTCQVADERIRVPSEKHQAAQRACTGPCQATRRSTPPARLTSTPTPRLSCSSSCPICSRTFRSSG